MARRWTAPIVVAALGAAYFARTAARGLQPFDSAEFALNAAQFGVGHPPGQPLYLLLSVVAVRALRFVTPSFALVLLSIGATVLAAAFALRHAAASERGNAGGAPSGALAGLPFFAALAAFALPGVWDMATRAEVYPLAALLVAGALFAALHPQRSDADAATQQTAWALSPRRAAAVGGLLGLGASVNPAIALAGGVAAAPLVLARLGRTWAGSGRARAAAALALLAAVVAGVAGLSPYALLPWRGAQPGRALVWGEPLSGDALGFYLSGRDYRAWHVGSAEFIANLGRAAGWLLDEGLLPWLLLGALGFALSPLPRAAKATLPLGVLTALSLLALNHPFIPTNPDYDGYLLAWVWLALFGVVLLAEELASRTRRGRLLGAATVVVLGIAGGASGTPLPSRDRSASVLTEALAARALDATPPGGILIVESDHLAFATLYLHHVEGRRPDVAVIAFGLSNSSWFWRFLARVEPSLPPPHLDAPSREARIAALLAEAGRPVAGEHARLARLGGRPCFRAGFAVAGEPCAELPPDDAGKTAADRARLFSPALRPPPGSLDERLFVQVIAQMADDHLRIDGDSRTALDLLGDAVGTRFPDEVRPAVAPHLLTPLTEPRALLPPGVLWLRLGDLLVDDYPDLAADCYRRAEIPEAEGALARLAARAVVPRPPPVAP